MKVVFSYLLMVVLLWNTLYVSLTYTYYYIDQSGFIERFCDNIDQPELECNGKCHLKDVVENKTTRDNVPESIALLEEINLFFYHKNRINFSIKDIETNKQIDCYFNLYSYTNVYSLYHPPQV